MRADIQNECYHFVGLIPEIETSSSVSLAFENTFNKRTSHKIHIVSGITPHQGRGNGNIIQRNWKLITILLILLSCIVLSLTYCQQTCIRIRNYFTRLTSTSQPY